MGFIIRGFIWDIPILIFAYVLFGGPSLVFEDVGGWYLVGFRVAGSGVSGLTQGWSAFLKRGGFLGVQGFGAWGCGAFAWGMLKA